MADGLPRKAGASPRADGGVPSQTTPVVDIQGAGCTEVRWP